MPHIFFAVRSVSVYARIRGESSDYNVDGKAGYLPGMNRKGPSRGREGDLNLTIEPSLRKRVETIEALLLDVDGVLTDGRIVLHGVRGEAKCFDVRDGHGIRLAMEFGGIRVGLLTARRSIVVERRARELGIRDVIQGAKDKKTAFEEYCRIQGWEANRVAFMGDDLIDLPVLNRAGLALAPADAVEEVRRRAHYITVREGGRGAVREAVEWILKIQGKWETILRGYDG